MLPEIKGRIAWIFKEENFDIDLIVGIDYMGTKDIEVLKSVCMKDYDSNFSSVVKQGDVLIGGENFGYGHPHYPSFKALRALGVSAVIAESFSPGFYRGETTNGFPLIECPGILDISDRWDEIEFDWDNEKINFPKKTISKQCNPIPKKTKTLVEQGGIIGYLKETI